MIRLLERKAPLATLQLWGAGDAPLGLACPLETLIIEWRGAPGPTSYALLGARRADQGVVITAPQSGPRLVGSLAYGDYVEVGLHEQYREAVILAFETALEGGGCEVPVAAHAHIGSSIMAFRRLSLFLAEALDGDVFDGQDDVVWQAWDRSARAWTQDGA